jgi:hypothetical protein
VLEADDMRSKRGVVAPGTNVEETNGMIDLMSTERVAANFISKDTRKFEALDAEGEMLSLHIIYELDVPRFFCLIKTSRSICYDFVIVLGACSTQNLMKGRANRIRLRPYILRPFTGICRTEFGHPLIRTPLISCSFLTQSTPNLRYYIVLTFYKC